MTKVVGRIITQTNRPAAQMCPSLSYANQHFVSELAADRHPLIQKVTVAASCSAADVKITLFADAFSLALFVWKIFIQPQIVRARAADASLGR